MLFLLYHKTCLPNLGITAIQIRFPHPVSAGGNNLNKNKTSKIMKKKNLNIIFKSQERSRPMKTKDLVFKWANFSFNYILAFGFI